MARSFVRAEGFDSRGPACGYIDLVVASETEASVIAVTYDVAD